MADKKIVKEWLDEAEEDFIFASVSLKERDKFFSRICFLFQQAAEKYLKAYIVAYDLPFEKIHDLTKLVRLCMTKEDSFEEIMDEAEFLTDLYVDTRYPAMWPVGRSKKEAKKAEKAAKTIGDFVKAKLG